MDQPSHKEERLEDAAKGVVSKNLDAVEGSVDTVIDQAKTQLHELRQEAQEVSEQALGRVERSCDDTLTNWEIPSFPSVAGLRSFFLCHRIYLFAEESPEAARWI